MTERRTYWLSFAGGARRGVAVIDVDEFDAAAATLVYGELPDPVQGPWFLAAVSKATLKQCNPGGQVRGWAVNPMEFADVPRDTLLSRADLLALQAKRRRN